MIRLGRGEISPPDSNTVASRQNTSTDTNTMTMDTNVRLPLDMGISASADLNSRTLSSLSANSRSEESTLPTLDFKWSNMEKRIPFIKRYMNNIQLTSKFSIKNAKEWLNESVRPASDKTAKNYSPLVSMNGILLNGLQTSLSYSMSTETNLTLSGETSSTTFSDRNDINADFRYNISPSSGLLKRLNIKSSIDLQLTFGASNDEQKRSIENKATATIAKNSRWTISPKADYRFSDKFTGSAMVRVENSRDMTNKVHKVREVSISGRMIF
jgi:cell surface protein SprA